MMEVVNVGTELTRCPSCKAVVLVGGRVYNYIIKGGGFMK